MKVIFKKFFVMLAIIVFALGAFCQDQPRPRARDIGITVGVLPPGPLNAITDVAGVKVGHTTLIRGDNVARVSPPFCRMAETSFEKKSQERCLLAMPLES